MKPKLHFLFFFFLFLCEFQSGFTEDWKRVYLATYPRSGNHWVRYLIEEATHIATSSVYCDPDPQHLTNPFPWGGYCCYHGYEANCRYPEKNEMIVVKTHFPAQGNISPYDKLPYQKVIRIVRHPVDSIYSRYVRKCGGNPRRKKVPTQLVKSFLVAWKKFQNYWNIQKNVLTIRYEDLLDNPYKELETILNALSYPVTSEDIQRAVDKYPPQGHVLKHIGNFKEKDLQLISNELRILLHQFQYQIAKEAPSKEAPL